MNQTIIINRKILRKYSLFLESKMYLKMNLQFYFFNIAKVIYIIRLWDVSHLIV